MKFTYSMFLVLLCCQYGVGYRVYILPEPGAFCLGVFSGDDCITWTDYSANPTFVYHSTTLIFTPGNYSLSGNPGRFSVTNIETFIMIGDRAQLEFLLSLSNIGYVGIHNLTFPETRNSHGFDVRDVYHFVIENCILLEQSLSFYTNYPRNSLVNIVNSTFERVLIDIHSYSTTFTTTLIISSSLFTKSLRSITDYNSNIIIQTSRFTNNYVSNNLVYAQGSLTVVDCLFDGNHITGTNTGVLYGTGNVANSHKQQLH